MRAVCIRLLGIVLAVGSAASLACSGGGGGGSSHDEPVCTMTAQVAGQTFSSSSAYFQTPSAGLVRVVGYTSDNREIWLDFNSPSSLPATYPLKGSAATAVVWLVGPGGYRDNYYAVNSTGQVVISDYTPATHIKGEFYFDAYSSVRGTIQVRSGSFDLACAT